MSKALSLALAWLVASSTLAADWPGWRGPTGQGHSSEKGLPIVWGGKDDRNVLWKAALPGQESNAAQDQNQSSPIVSRGRVFVTMSYWPGKTDPKKFPEHHVACYRASDGHLLWDVQIPPGPWLLSDLRGGYTAPTPAADGERVFVVFGSAVIAALDYDGKLIWRKELHPHKFDVALGASPVLFEGSVILQSDQLEKQSRLVAFDGRTGNVKWETPRPTANFSHSTPVLAALNGRQQLLVSASNAVQGYDPTDGKILWWTTAKGDTVSPVLGGNIVYCDSGRGGSGIAVDPTGTGDVSKTHVKWNVEKLPEGFSSPIVVGDYLYRLNRPALLKCFRLATGEEVYSESLTGVSVPSSPVATADGRIFLASAGKSFVVKAGAAFEVLEVNDLGDPGQASAAVAEGRLFLKGRKWLFCVGNKQ